MGKGKVCTVPFGITTHCATCGAELKAGDQCYIEDGTGAILCLRCLNKRQIEARVGPTEFKEPALTDAQEQQVADWMRYD